MCDFDNGFVLCTCKEKPTVHHKNSRRNKRAEANAPLKYLWYLLECAKLDGPEHFLKEGLYQLPASDIGKGLTEEWVLLHLNVGHCFDFTYTPNEGDYLVIRESQQHGIFLSFIFRDGSWVSGFYNPFTTNEKLKMAGEVKQVGNE
jgi:hypothetical protein